MDVQLDDLILLKDKSVLGSSEVAFDGSTVDNLEQSWKIGWDN